MADIKTLVEAQRTYFLAGNTLDIEARLDALTKLRHAIVEYEDRIIEAVRRDMGRSDVETYFNEIYLNLEEAEHAIRHLRQWMEPKHEKTPNLFFMADSELHAEPYGVTLIISAWNYPLLQLFSPLIGALAAGNTAILKPASESVHCSRIAKELISKIFSPELVAVVEGTSEITTQLLEEKFDYIFFTGSPRVGRIIQTAAARNLTPVTLELGGKSPAIVDARADIELAAKRIVWCKLSNAGQLCITVDHAYVHASIKDAFIAACRRWILEFYGEDPSASEDYGFLINHKNFDRVISYLGSGTIVHGGRHDRARRYIEPTILDDVPEDAPVMQDEIFGPILPILSFDSLDALLARQRTKEKPLALYLFTKDKESQAKVLRTTSSGGVTINDCMSHCGTPYLPFGGVGNSGMGGYHGKHSFDTFTHFKAVMIAPTAKMLDFSVKYPPYAGKRNTLHRLSKFHLL